MCLEKDVSLLAYSPLAGGTLSGKYITGEQADNSRLNIFKGYMERYNKSAAREATVQYMEVCRPATCPVQCRRCVRCMRLACAASAGRRCSPSACCQLHPTRKS